MKLAKAVEVDDDDVVDVDAEEVLDGLDCLGGVAVGAVRVAGKRGVDLCSPQLGIAA